MSFGDRMRRREIEIQEDTIDRIVSSDRRKIETLPNGDKLVHNGRQGIVYDGATNEMVGFRVYHGAVGGTGQFYEAEFSHHDQYGNSGYGLHKKKPGVIGPSPRRNRTPRPIRGNNSSFFRRKRRFI